MEAPFTKLGPGQSGRLVYQVMGENGPIFNPSKIRYLPPDQAAMSNLGESSPLSGDGASTIATGLAGVNLLVSAGTLTLAAATYTQCKQILSLVTRIAVDIEDMKSSLREINDRVRRIDTRVAENNLREALRHAFREAFSPKAINLKALHCLVGDIEGFNETLEAPLIFNFSIRLSSDVRKELVTLLTFLANLRMLLSHQHNVDVGGHPRLTVKLNGVDEYFDVPLDEIIALAFHFGRADATFLNFAESLSESVFSEFTFSDEHDAKKFSELAHEQCYRPVWRDRLSNYAAQEAETLLNALGPLKLDYSDASNRSHVADAAHSWFYNSDAALLYRVGRELVGLQQGYRASFYPYLPELDEEKAEPEQHLFECDIGNAATDED